MKLDRVAFVTREVPLMAVDETNPRFQAVLGVAARLLAANVVHLGGIEKAGTDASVAQSVDLAVKLVDKTKEQVLDVSRRK